VGDADRIFVAYSSTHGATAQIAEAIGSTPQRAGFAVDVIPAGRLAALDPDGAVIVGRAVCMGHWRPAALHVPRRPELRGRAVWPFSSGPVGEANDDPTAERWTGPECVRTIAGGTGVRDHTVCGGMVDSDSGFTRQRMARGLRPGLRARRDWSEIGDWAESIARTLSASSVSAAGESVNSE
jgi:menaquinone-dependent protoporphyrinogen oxidase